MTAMASEACGYVPVGPLRDAFLAAGGDAYGVALRAGWMMPNQPETPDSYRVRRALGLAAYHMSHGYEGRCVRRWVRRQTALTLLAAMCLDPHEIPELGL